MHIEDVIESLNRHIEMKRKLLDIEPNSGHLVLQKTIKPHESFKAYKEYNITVWFVRNRNKYRTFTVNHMSKITTEAQEEAVLYKLSMELCTMIFNWMGSSLYEQIVKGEYDGYEK